MFNLVPTTAPNVSILMTGDGHGLTLDSSISKTNTAATIEFDIFKIMHHGSSNNNLLAQVKGDLTPVTQAITRLFEKYKAKKYVISCDSLGKHPNVDLVRASKDRYLGYLILTGYLYWSCCCTRRGYHAPKPLSHQRMLIFMVG